jgi:hypothetical protein
MKKGVLIAVLTTVMLFGNSCEKSEKPEKVVIDFEELALDESGFWNGSDGSGGFQSGNGFFNNRYDMEWESWFGYSYSNHTDTSSPGYDNQYSAITGSGADESEQYGVYYYYYQQPDTIWFGPQKKITSISLTNTTNTYMAMLNGDAFAKKFGGETGDDPDWFRVSVKGIGPDDTVTETINIYLADYRFDNNDENYIVDRWVKRDLSELGYIKGLVIEIESSDTSQWGPNTPAYVCIDNIEGFLLEDDL